MESYDSASALEGSRLVWTCDQPFASWAVGVYLFIIDEAALALFFRFSSGVSGVLRGWGLGGFSALCAA